MEKKAEFRVTDITEYHVQTVRQLICDNPSWDRSRLSRELCQLWNWRSPLGPGVCGPIPVSHHQLYVALFYKLFVCLEKLVHYRGDIIHGFL